MSCRFFGFTLPIEVERDGFCQSVLRARQKDGLLDMCEIEDDVTTYKPTGEDKSAELVLAGFPCQVGSVKEVNFEIHSFHHQCSSCGARAFPPQGNRPACRMGAQS